MSGQRENTIGMVFLLCTAVCWGFVASTVKRLTGIVDPYTISFYRVFLALIVFVTLFVVRKGNWRRLHWAWPWIVIGALGRAGNYLLYNTGLVYAPSNAATILAPVQGIVTVLLARWFVRERIRDKWFGLTLSLGGLILIWWNGQGWQTLADPRYFLGNLLLVLAGVASALQFTSQKVLSVRLSSLEILLPVFAWSTAVAFPFAWAAGGLIKPYSPGTWGLLLFLGLVLTGGSFLFLAEGYRRCSATTAVVITNTSTFLTLLWSFVLLHEAIHPPMIVGVLLAVAGTIAVIRSDGREADKRV